MDPQTLLATINMKYIGSAFGLFIGHLIQNHIFLCKVTKNIKSAKDAETDNLRQKGNLKDLAVNDLLDIHTKVHNIERTYHPLERCVNWNYNCGVLLAVSIAILGIAPAITYAQVQSAFYMIGMMGALYTGIPFAVTFFLLGKWQLKYNRETAK